MYSAVVIGANFGDEGKGLMTDRIISAITDKNVLNVRFNGGGQAGHTVVTGSNSHIFNHIGSGSLRNSNTKNVDTYLASECIIEPLTLIKEIDLIENIIGRRINIYINEQCRLTTPLEISLNDARESMRNKNKHGSCGMGIFETITRNKVIPFSLSDIYKGRENFDVKLKNIYNYYREEMIALGYKEEDINSRLVGDSIKETIDIIYEVFMQLKSKIVKITNEKDLIKVYKSVVFEGAQGLMLDMDNTEYMPHLTPSNTGAKYVADILQGVVEEKDELGVFYVTRTYLTRHGNGRLDNETIREELGSNVSDETNVANKYQGELRYGLIDLNNIQSCIDKDFKIFKGLKCKMEKNVVITHLDQTNGILKTANGDITIDDLIVNNYFNCDNYLSSWSAKTN